ncbi:(3R)-3-hydroxyacyl-CoA dehydrogenase-like [Haemaphysalis longicornis]
MAGNEQLAGRLALVTGGGSGIGRAVCKALSSEGARVIAADKNKEGAAATINELTGLQEHRAVEVDVGNADSVSSLFAEIKKVYSAPVSIVVNCAGIVRNSYLIDMSEEVFDDVLKINLKGTYLVTQAAAREMVSSAVPHGTIVNISSIVGKTGTASQCSYVASKAGVVGFTKSVALELAKHNIRCNAIMPGFIETPMVAAVPENVLAKFVPSIPMGRIGKPEELASAVLFLCSPGSSYVTGTVLEVTGGWCM